MRVTSLRVMSIAICALLAASAAQAHPRLMHAEPAPASTVATSPTAIRLIFNMPIEVKFASVRLFSSTGQQVHLSSVTVDPRDTKEVVVAVPSLLTAGDYSVEWRVVGVDTHWKAGRYAFRIEQ